MEIIVYLNVAESSIWIRDGYLNFTGREGDDEASKHSINLLSVQRYKFLNDVLTVYFKEEDQPEWRAVEHHPLGEEETTLIDIEIDLDDDDEGDEGDEWKA